jgi:hypothetical protein
VISGIDILERKQLDNCIDKLCVIIVCRLPWCTNLSTTTGRKEPKAHRRKITDERVVTLISRVLKAGIMIDGIWVKKTEGCPQGFPLSLMSSNIVLS